MWVIKLGGSLAQSAHLSAWLDAIGQTDAIIVPGGGPFADAVRKAQAHWGFDEQTAHEMAILGMRQYGRMLAGLCPGLSLADAEELAARQGPAKVWLPLPERLNEAGLPASWDISSDSLAAWLAGQVHAENLLLVKSADMAGIQALDTEAAADKGWIDPAFRRYAQGQSFRSWLCGADAYASLPEGLADPARFFCLLRQHRGLE